MNNLPLMSKGISPLIAAVLLIAFTMGIAGIAGPYMTQLMQESTEGQQEQADTLLDASKAGLEIMDASYSSSEDTVEVTVRNTGSIPIEKYAVSAFGDDTGQTQVNETLDKKEVSTVKVNTTSTPDKIQVAGENMPVEAEEDGDDLVTGAAPAAPTGLSISS